MRSRIDSRGSLKAAVSATAARAPVGKGKTPPWVLYSLYEPQVRARLSVYAIDAKYKPVGRQAPIFGH